MQALLGNLNYRLNDLIKISEFWTTNSCANISIKKEWDIFTTIKPDPIINKFAGGKDGRLIARYEIAFSERPESIVTLYDHKLNVIANCHVHETCKDIFIYVTKTDELRVVTSSGRLFTFQGENQVSSFPILCPELEPVQDINSDVPAAVRNREILDVAFWETGFVYIDRDGNIVQYNIDPSKLQPTNYVEGNYNSHIYDFDKQYLKNIQNPNDVRTKILAKGTKIGKPVSFDCIPPEYTGLSDSPYVILADQDSNIHIITSTEHNSFKTADQIYAFSISPSYSLVAFIVDPMILMVMPITLDSIFIRVELSEGETFEQISWAGDDIPVVSFSDTALLALSSGDLIEIPTEGKSVLFQQSDCALVLTDKALFRVGVVNPSIEKCLGIVSSEQSETTAENDTYFVTRVSVISDSSQFLLDAPNDNFREVKITVTPPARLIRSFCQYSPAKVIKMKDDGILQEAIKDCITAAQFLPCPSADEEERYYTTKQPPSSLLSNGNPVMGSDGQYHNANPQTILMASACFGKTLLMMPCGNSPPLDQETLSSLNEEYVKTARWIRLANMFKKQLNISVSPNDLMKSVTIDEVVARLCLRGQFSPAFEVADDFSADKAAVITRWSSTIMNVVQDDEMCFNFLMQMKRMHMPSIVTNAAPASQLRIKTPPAFANPVSKLIGRQTNSSRSITIDPQALSVDNHEKATTCALFDTASIASAALRLGRMDLALAIAKSEKNAKLVIPFYAASGMWKEAVNASVYTCDSNVFIEVLRRAIVEIGEADVVEAIGQNYFSYASILKLTNRAPKPKPTQRTGNDSKPLARRRRDKNVSGLNQQSVSAISNAQMNFIDTLNALLQKVELNTNTLDLHLSRQLHKMNAQFQENHKSVSFTDKAAIQNTANSINEIATDFPDMLWVQGQATLMNDQLDLCHLYETFVSHVQKIAKQSSATTVDHDAKAKVEQLASIDINTLTANKLIQYAVDLHQLSSLIQFAKDSNSALIKPNKAIVIAARYLATQNKYNDFVNLLSQNEDFIKQAQDISTAIAFHHFGKEGARNFVETIQDQKKKASLLEMINGGSDKLLQFDTYGSKDLACSLFKPTIFENLKK